MPGNGSARSSCPSWSYHSCAGSTSMFWPSSARSGQDMPDRPDDDPPRMFLLAIGLASSLGAAAGRAGGLVEFPNLSEQAPTKLRGYLARPDAGLSALLGGNSNRA